MSTDLQESERACAIVLRPAICVQIAVQIGHTPLISGVFSARVGKEFSLERAVPELLDNFDELGSDFGEFFPLLQAHAGKSTQAEPFA
jgi:hypothetical protein